MESKNQESWHLASPQRVSSHCREEACSCPPLHPPSKEDGCHGLVRFKNMEPSPVLGVGPQHVKAGVKGRSQSGDGSCLFLLSQTLEVRRGLGLLPISKEVRLLPLPAPFSLEGEARTRGRTGRERKQDKASGLGLHAWNWGQE